MKLKMTMMPVPKDGKIPPSKNETTEQGVHRSIIMIDKGSDLKMVADSIHEAAFEALQLASKEGENALAESLHDIVYSDLAKKFTRVSILTLLVSLIGRLAQHESETNCNPHPMLSLLAEHLMHKAAGDPCHCPVHTAMDVAIELVKGEKQVTADDCFEACSRVANSVSTWPDGTLAAQEARSESSNGAEGEGI